jgi:membrane protein implicated in regulation of membrane protease activity
MWPVFELMWAMFQMTALGWLVIAFIAAVLEVSIPHFGSAFVSAGAVAAALAAFLGFGVSAQLATFIVVMMASLVTLRSRLVGRIGGPGVPSRTQSLVGRQGVVTHDIDPTIGAGRVNVSGEDWAARSIDVIAAGTRVKVIGADGIVLEVTRT